MFSTVPPVLLLAWRRPDTIRQVINAIRVVAPTQLFIACDGPNHNRIGEAAKVAATRDVLDTEIDWPCHVQRLYSEVNQGCRIGVSRAISWFFDNVEEGIILEDDCVPHPDFFSYCQTLLELYRDDTRVWCISGDNFQDGNWRGDGSYYFSRYSHCWGWASWRRCWQHYDDELIQWRSFRDSGHLTVVFEDPIERRFWTNLLQTVAYQGRPDSWAYRWAFTCFINGGLTILPNCNLITNVGVGPDATHTKKSTIRSLQSNGLPIINHPSFLLRDATADRYTFFHHYADLRSRIYQILMNFLTNLFHAYPRRSRHR